MQNLATIFFSLMIVFCALLAPRSAYGEDAVEQKAQSLYLSLTSTHLLEGNPLRQPVLDAVKSGDLARAASLITDPTNGDKNFYDVTVRNFALPINVTESMTIDPTDLTALIIGITRDDLPFDNIVTGNFFYANPLLSGNNAYNISNNTHYQYIDRYSSFAKTLQKQTGTGNSGIFTRRAFAEDFYRMGTNRRPWKAIVELLYCVPHESIKSLYVPDAYVRRDVPRFGADGTSKTYSSSCRGCHAQMDPVSFAFGHYDWDVNNQRIIMNPIYKDKVNETNNITYEPKSDTWYLYVTQAQNSIFGFQDIVGGDSSTPPINFSTVAGDLKVATGSGVRDLGRVIAGSTGFASCIVNRVMSQMYLKKVWTLGEMSEADLGKLKSQESVKQRLLNSFQNSRSLRKLFEEAAVTYLPQ